MHRWVGKIAVVTGASSGIGAAICVALANESIRVVGLARRAARVEELQSKVLTKGIIIPRKCDVSNAEEVAATFKWIEESLGEVHIMINNAGIIHPGGITDAGNNIISEEDMVATLDTNVKGTMLCTRHAINSMTKHRVDGHIINVNSISGHYIPMLPQFNVYPATKYAITGFTATLLNELAHNKNKIKVTSLSPGLVITEMKGVDQLKSYPALKPEDIAQAALYVLSTPPHVNINELTISAVTELRA